MMNNLRVFGMNATAKFAEAVADHLDINLSKHVEKYFSDKEPYVRADENVRGCDCYIIQSLYSDENESVNDKFMKLCFFIGSLWDASADRITLVAPYLSYQRQDRKTESRAGIHTKYMSMMLENVGLKRVLTMDVHSLKVYQNAVRCRTDHLEAKNLMVDYFVQELKDSTAEIAVLSPDSGGTERSERFRKKLAIKMNRKIDLVHMDKVREGDIVHGSRITDDVKGKIILVVDDMIASGSTLVKAHETVEKFGGTLYASCATHPLCVGNVNDNLAKLNRLVVTDTIPLRVSDEIKAKIKVLSTTKLFARAIRRIHDEGGSISDLLR
jgi:ribose-phosphate pyrophosphokinase